MNDLNEFDFDGADDSTIETEADRRAEERLQTEMAELRKQHEEDMHQATSAAIASERQRESQAANELRELYSRTGMDTAKLIEAHRAREIERIQEEEFISEPAARALYEAKSKAALLEAREADRQREHTEQMQEAAYRDARRSFLADNNVPDIYKTALKKFGPQIDEFSNYGRPLPNGLVVDFDVAAKYVIGQNLPEIMAGLNQDDSPEKSKSSASTTTTRPKAPLTDAAKQMLEDFGMAPDEVTTAKETRRRKRADPSDELGQWAARFGLDPTAVAKRRGERR